MARVNHEQFMAKLLAHVASKPNHGKRELLDTIIAFQTEAMTDEDQYREFLHRFGEEVEDAVLNLLPNRSGHPTDSTGDELAGATREEVQPSAIGHTATEAHKWKPALPEHRHDPTLLTSATAS